MDPKPSLNPADYDYEDYSFRGSEDDKYVPKGEYDEYRGEDDGAYVLVTRRPSADKYRPRTPRNYGYRYSPNDYR